ncbi:hypothetical protein [Mammaliicoccus sciuri]|jgi:hypothetical protein|uniref:hypothetical protein n=1 Tax=Mammaliicoccus sciuri TaxID=1296 RepID=UPI0021D3BC29|nr:hypothetical protein [Mammaliicoccus sciuri]UXV33117.1 hypothetical protein MUA60_04875 [Mammaliicoccus sciuri]
MLDPKPNNKKSLLGWEDLNSKLQAVFEKSYKTEEPVAAINSDEYFMSIDEIKSEAEEKGYKVNVIGNFVEFR